MEGRKGWCGSFITFFLAHFSSCLSLPSLTFREASEMEGLQMCLSTFPRLLQQWVTSVLESRVIYFICFLSTRLIFFFFPWGGISMQGILYNSLEMTFSRRSFARKELPFLYRISLLSHLGTYSVDDIWWKLVLWCGSSLSLHCIVPGDNALLPRRVGGGRDSYSLVRCVSSTKLKLFDSRAFQSSVFGQATKNLLHDHSKLSNSDDATPPAVTKNIFLFDIVKTLFIS